MEDENESKALWLAGSAYGLLMGAWLGGDIYERIALAILAGLAWLLAAGLHFRRRFSGWIWNTRLGNSRRKLVELEEDLARLRLQIDRDFPGELPECPLYDYKEQDVIDTAGLLLGRYCIYARAGGLTQTGQAAFYHASDISEGGVVGEPPDQPTFASRRLPGRAVHRVDG